MVEWINDDLGLVGYVNGKSVCIITTTYRALTGTTYGLYLLPDGPLENFTSESNARDVAEELHR